MRLSLTEKAPALRCNPRLPDKKEEGMTQQALIKGEVCFRAGDGVLMPIPPGAVEIELADDSATFGWTDTDGSPGSAAITRDEYERYLNEGLIRLGQD
jgi:hypothetical protein